MVDIATRVHNHKWKIDPIVRSLIDTDFYKLLMCQSIFRNKPDILGHRCWLQQRHRPFDTGMQIKRFRQDHRLARL